MRSSIRYESQKGKKMQEKTENLKGKKLLILGGAHLHCGLVKTAKDLGIETFVTDNLPIGISPARQLADHAWELNVTDVDTIVERCRQEHIDGVINIYFNFCQIPYQQICERLGLPCFGTREQYRIFTDKKRFLNTCVEHGLDIIPAYREEDFAFDNSSIEYPVYVKPSDSRGSRGQHICRSYTEVGPAIEQARRESTNGGVIIEKFMENAKDVHISLLMIDGEPWLEGAFDMYSGFDENMQILPYAFAIKSHESGAYVNEQLRGRLGDMLRALKLQNSPVSLQGFLSGGRLYLHDCALSFAGDLYEEALKNKLGLDIYSPLIAFSLSGRFPSRLKNILRLANLNKIVMTSMRVYVRPGRIHTIRGIEEAVKRKGVFNFVSAYKEGDVIEDWHDIRQNFSLFAIGVESKAEEHEVIKYIYETLQVLDENGEDMKLPLPDMPWLRD